MPDFRFDGLPTRVVLRPGAVNDVADEVRQLKCTRIMVIGGDATLALAEHVRAQLGTSSVGTFTDVVQHVPAHQARQVVQAAQESHADGVITVGGGSATGLGKIVALALKLPFIAIPTTFAGSEMTPIYGVTGPDGKQTGSDPKVRPRLVLYDPELTSTMPAKFIATSGVNALAHCVQALTSSNPFAQAFGLQGARDLTTALPQLMEDPLNVDLHSITLAGAALAGAALGLAGSGIHHAICHVLGGAFGLEHSATHSAVLAQSVGLTLRDNPHARGAISWVLNEDDVENGMYDWVGRLGISMSLEDQGLTERQGREATGRISEHVNHGPFSAHDIAEVVERARIGLRPSKDRAASTLRSMV